MTQDGEKQGGKRPGKGKAFATGLTSTFYDMKWFKEKLQIKIEAVGVHAIRIDAEGFCPHISAILFSPADPDAPLSDSAEYDGEEFNTPEASNWEQEGFAPLQDGDCLLPLCTWDTAKDTFWKDRTQVNLLGRDRATKCCQANRAAELIKISSLWLCI